MTRFALIVINIAISTDDIRNIRLVYGHKADLDPKVQTVSAKTLNTCRQLSIVSPPNCEFMDIARYIKGGNIRAYSQLKSTLQA